MDLRRGELRKGGICWVHLRDGAFNWNSGAGTREGSWGFQLRLIGSQSEGYWIFSNGVQRKRSPKIGDCSQTRPVPFRVVHPGKPAKHSSNSETLDGEQIQKYWTRLCRPSSIFLLSHSSWPRARTGVAPPQRSRPPPQGQCIPHFRQFLQPPRPGLALVIRLRLSAVQDCDAHPADGLRLEL